MKRKEKAERIQSMLEELYPETPVPLDHESPFQLLVAVLMSAQTTDLKVNQVTPALFKQGPTPEKMANLEVATIQSLIREVGLAPTKAKNIRRLSELLIERHQGNIPNTFEELEALPGVGHKTAGVVLAQAFNIPAFPVDTHIHRLAARWGLSNGKNVDQTEKDLKAVFPKDAWNSLHLQIIFFGREYCPARFHDLSQCPICSWAATKKRINEEAKMNKSKSKKSKRNA
ncbi:MAG: endonuclease III [Euryarchaeota archaeon]|nr:endonuclease III [Euryarchaeota archaeon]|tara:strand:+ start:3130 stop:3816 length:687 start_codon:yes stop_codon:yes gene_type:complete